MTREPHYYWNDIADTPVVAHRGRSAPVRAAALVYVFGAVFILTVLLGSLVLAFV